MESTCRLLIDPPGEGPWNMAVDEVLLESAAENGLATLRFYRWKVPTLSLGYFQSSADRTQHAPSLKCSLVRRSTGGGAILHDRELTYSVALPAHHPLATDADRLYCAVHSALLGVLNERLEAASELKAQRCVFPEVPPVKPFLCFHRRASGDLLLTRDPESRTAQKVAGSAQRRRRGAVLQHGSLLLAASPFAPELPGIVELTGVRFDLGRLISDWARELQSVLPWGVEQPLSDEEAALASKLETERFASSAWTNRR